MENKYLHEDWRVFQDVLLSGEYYLKMQLI